MEVRMMHQCRSPTMENGEEAELGTEMFGISGNGTELVVHRLEEDYVDHPFVLVRDGGDFLRDGEHDVEILDRQQFGFASLDPGRTSQGLTGRTMSVAAAVVPHARVSTVVALFDMAAEGGRPTLLNGSHHAPLSRRECRTDLVTISRAMAAEHLRHGQRRTIHRPAPSEMLGRGRRRRGRDRTRQQVERACRGADLTGRDAQVASGCRQTAMAEEELNR